MLRRLCNWVVGIPPSVEVIEFVSIPLVREVDLVLALCLPSSERLYLLREELCTH